MGEREGGGTFCPLGIIPEAKGDGKGFARFCQKQNFHTSMSCCVLSGTLDMYGTVAPNFVQSNWRFSCLGYKNRSRVSAVT